MDIKKYIFKMTLILGLAELVCAGITVGIFAMLGYFHWNVIVGSLVGLLLTVGNFFLMAVGTQIAANQAQEQDVKTGKATIHFSYFGRIIVMFAVLAAFAAAGWGQPIAMVIPLLLERPILTVADYLGRKGDQ